MSTFVESGSVTEYVFSTNSELLIAATGYVGAYGVRCQHAPTMAYTVVNYGKINATYSSYEVFLEDGGTVTNGSAALPAAVIEGGEGIYIAGNVATITNFGSILAVTQYALHIVLGVITNGSRFDTKAEISGPTGVYLAGYSTITNYGQISASAGLASAIDARGGARLVNGAATDTAALIEGGTGLEVGGGGGSVTNFGTILGLYAAGVRLAEGRLINGSAGDHGALIEGYSGVTVSGGTGAVTNFGTILAVGGDASAVGVELTAGGSVTNGSVTDKTALIQGYGGLNAPDGGTVANFATILGDGAGYAVTLVGGRLTNGAVNDTTARIDGYNGVYLSGGATLTNFGTVVAEGGFALNDLAANPSTVVAEAGSVFVGAVTMNGGPLQLVGGVVTMGGLETSGTVSGAGTLALDAGTSIFEPGASLAISQVNVSGATTVVNVAVASLGYAGTWLQSDGTLNVIVGEKITFTGSGDTFAGTVSGAGSVVWSGGSDTFSGLTLSATSQTVSGAEITMSGAINLTTNMSLTSSNLIVASSGAVLGGAGEFILSANASNSLYGVSNATTLIVNGRLYGAGQLGAGQLTLIIGAGGFVDGYTTVALTINTGSNIIQDAGTIYAIGAGGTIVDSAVDNTGKLYADGGTLTLEGAVTGAGIGDITSGTLFAASTFTENVTFTASTKGTLELADSQTYTGDVTGFSLTGATALDLGDIDFINGTTKATYSGTATSGTLTVTDGTHTAHITLEGNYTSSTFTVSSDGHGGTKVVDPSKAPVGGLPPASPQPLIAAMASLGGTASDHLSSPLSHLPAALLISPPRAAQT